jgi:hypothetical protein
MIPIRPRISDKHIKTVFSAVPQRQPQGLSLNRLPLLVGLASPCLPSSQGMCLIQSKMFTYPAYTAMGSVAQELDRVAITTT